MKERETGKQKGSDRPLSAEDFLLTWVGGATDNRAGLLSACCFSVMVSMVSAVCLGVYVGSVCVRACVRVSPAMSGHTTADSRARRSCRPGGHEAREGGEGRKW